MLRPGAVRNSPLDFLEKRGLSTTVPFTPGYHSAASSAFEPSTTGSASNPRVEWSGTASEWPTHRSWADSLTHLESDGADSTYLSRALSIILEHAVHKLPSSGDFFVLLKRQPVSRFRYAIVTLKQVRKHLQEPPLIIVDLGQIALQSVNFVK